MKQADAQNGLLIVVMSGLLTLLMVVGVVVTSFSRLERGQSASRLDRAWGKLLARSGFEYALARMVEPPDPAPVAQASVPEEDWRYRDDPETPLETAFNPSYNDDPYEDSDGNGRYQPGDPYDDPDGNTRYDGWSGRLRGHYASYSDRFKLRIAGANAGIYINGGALDELDLDPDGPSADPVMVFLEPGLAEAAPLQPNGIPDHRDVSSEGPNGFLVRLLDNLDQAVTGTGAPSLGGEIVGNRPAGGYGSLEELEPVLGTERLKQFAPYLTMYAWVDPKTIKPQPMNGRPQRFVDIDDAHRIGARPVAVGGEAGLFSVTGDGTESSLWEVELSNVNMYEGVRTYPVRWERNFIYAWKQMRPAPLQMEPRAPVSAHDAPEEVLEAVFLGLKGTCLEVWDGSAGWDGGFGWFQMGGTAVGNSPQTYPYPDPATEEIPWHRARAEYGSSYGLSGKPWYAPTAYDANLPGPGGKPLVWNAPLGRLKETQSLEIGQAQGIAQALRERVRETGRVGSWDRFRGFTDSLPLWEDLEGDGRQDGEPYTVQSNESTYTRRMYKREDFHPDGMFNLETFPQTGGVAGLTFVQKDLLRAMADPNTGLNDFNPDANLWKEVDKSDLAGIEPAPSAYVHTTELSLSETGVFRVGSLGLVFGKEDRIAAESRVEGVVRSMETYRETSQADFMRGYPSGERTLPEIFPAPSAPYPLAGGQALVTYPSPQSRLEEPLEEIAGADPIPTGSYGGLNRRPAADAGYDGRVGLGFIGVEPSPPSRKLWGDLFDTLDARSEVPGAGLAVSDLKGPYPVRLLGDPGKPVGNLFPDGVYSEKDTALKYPVAGNFVEMEVNLVAGTNQGFRTQQGVGADANASTTGPPLTYVFYVSCWVKSNWFPEASPRPHALLSLSRGGVPGSAAYDTPAGFTPMDHVPTHPFGVYFVPARNNAWQDSVGIYDHSASSTRGEGWPRRSLLWGTTHTLFASDTLNRRGIADSSSASQEERLEGHRWHHLAAIGKTAWFDADGRPSRNSSVLMLDGRPGSQTGGGWNFGFGAIRKALGFLHEDGTPNHVRFGEIAGVPNMNYTADATFAGLRIGGEVAVNEGDGRTDPNATVTPRGGMQGGPVRVEGGGSLSPPGIEHGLGYRTWIDAYRQYFSGTSGPAASGRYFKEPEARFVSDLLPEEVGRPRRVTWTPVSADPHSDVSNGIVRIVLEIWDDMGTQNRFDDRLLLASGDPDGDNLIPDSRGRIYYQAVFINEWDQTTRLNRPLNVTPYLDDVTFHYQRDGGPQLLSWSEN